MFYAFLYPLNDISIVFNIFKYITVRSGGAAVTAFLLALWLGPKMIEWLKTLSWTAANQREYAEKIHKFYEGKKKVPTMGGLLIIASILISVLLWGNFSNPYVILSLAVLIGFGAIGFIDDYLKIRSKSSNGLRFYAKLSGQLLLGLFLAVYLLLDPKFDQLIYLPFFKSFAVYLGILFIPFVICVLLGTSNALNLTDGLDGLAIGCLVFSAGTFAIVSYISGHATFAKYLGIPFVPYSGELAVFCSAMVGASAGFLWFNSFPATVFMGDTGSLSLGGALGAVALFIKKELLLLIVGGIFVWEALSVIVQVISFKFFKKRIFLMSPFHHHLQLLGWPESKVTVRLWIIAFILSIVGLSTLKIR